MYCGHLFIHSGTGVRTSRLESHSENTPLSRRDLSCKLIVIVMATCTYITLCSVNKSDDNTVLREMHNMLVKLTKRVKGNEIQLNEIKRKVCSTTTTSDSCSASAKRKISPLVRVRN